MSERYHIVIFGATGFTGQFVIEEVARLKKYRWAVAGRNQAKLKDALTQAGKRVKFDLSGIPIIIADVNDEASLTKMCQQAQVIINCVGPYRFWGEPVVKAAIQNGANHVDISGEPVYLEGMQLKYNDQARQKGVYVVNACGWDSIPCEFGVQFARKQMPGDTNSVETVAEFVYGPKGLVTHTGTYNSMIHGIANRKDIIPIRRQLLPNRLPRSPYPLHKRKLLSWFEDLGYVIPFMGSDHSVVQRTQHYLYEREQVKPISVGCYMKLNGWFQGFCLILWGVMFFAMASLSFTRGLLEKFPKLFSFGMFSEEGPTMEQIEEAKFRYWFYARGWKTKLASDAQHSSPPDCKLVAVVEGPDPGYRATSICVTQAAMTILEDKDKMPKGGGVFPPGAAFAHTSLVDRLRNSGFVFRLAKEPTQTQ